jgi:ESCRT-II complex subunit VPS36
MKKAKDDAQRADATLNAAFADIDELMIKAKDVVQLAQKMAVAQNRQAKAQGGENADDAAFRAAMVQLGIASPVTRETAGSKYHDELSRQLADWLLKRPLQTSGGVLLMTDLYCMFNRARGTEMVSPDDLMRACMLFEPLKLPVRLKKFDSGVLVVMAAAESDDAVAKKMEAEIKKRGPLSAFSLSQALSIPLILAREQLELAEKLLVLCRDETLEGIVFYPNFFVRCVHVHKRVARFLSFFFLFGFPHDFFLLFPPSRFFERSSVSVERNE